jgi:hypothetical protein
MSGCVVMQGKVSEEQAAAQEELTALHERNKELEELEAATKVGHTVLQAYCAPVVVSR